MVFDRDRGAFSPILFTIYIAIYIDDLLDDLSTLGVGYYSDFFAGAMYYADDLVLLAPSPSALRLMLYTL